MTRMVTLLFVLGIFASACRADEASNISLVQDMADAINARDLDALVSPNIVRHSAATPGVVVTNLDEFKDFLKTDFATVPDSVQEIDIIFGTESYVAMKARYRGTQLGPFGPFPASGKKLELHFIGILRIEVGKIAEIWVEWDNLSALTQLGFFPSPATGPSDNGNAEQ